MSAAPSRFPDRSDSQVLSAPKPQETSLNPPPTPAWVDPRSNGLLSLFFVALLLAPLIVYGLGRKNPTTFDENRALAPAPVFGADPIVALPAEIEAYYADRFGFRSSLIHIYGILFRR